MRGAKEAMGRLVKTRFKTNL